MQRLDTLPRVDFHMVPGTPGMAESHGVWSMGRPEDWKIVRSAAQLKPPEENELRVSQSSKTPSALTLEGQAGGIYRSVPIDASLPHRFRGRVRSLDLQSTARGPFPGARLVLLELASGALLGGALRADWEGFIRRRTLLTGAPPDGGWLDCERVFLPHPETRQLVIACELSFGEALEFGRVEFADLELETIPWNQFWESSLAAASLDPRASGPASWRQSRWVAATLAHDNRPAIAELDGEEVTFSMRVGANTPILRTALGTWFDGLAAGLEGTQFFRVLVNQETIFTQSRPLAARYLENTWQDVELDLTPWRGESIELTLAFGGDGCGLWASPRVIDRGREDERPNVILISIDTLRADHMGLFGYPLPTTPTIDRFAAESLHCVQARSQAPYTLPAHATMLSGTFPRVHGAQGREDRVNPERTELLASLLARNGYHTQAFTGGGFVAPAFGFAQGFDSFVSLDPLRDPGSWYYRTWAQQDPEHMSLEVVHRRVGNALPEFLDERGDDPFFLFLHTYAVHSFESPPEVLELFEGDCETDWDDVRQTLRGDYRLKEPLGPAEAAHLIHRYDASIRWVDMQFALLLDELKSRGLDDNTIIILTSDHGEEILDRGDLQHGKTLHEEMLRVPLVIQIPGRSPRRLEAPAMHVDLVPTLLSALGIPPRTPLQGVDLYTLGPNSRRASWSEVRTDVRQTSLNSADSWKLIQHTRDGRLELYNLIDDPGERLDQSELEPARLQSLHDQLTRLGLSLDRLGAHSAQASDLRHGTITDLERLGY